ncbi:S1C family serine protease [Anaerosacchariphilus polymeriproducens]|uniref:Serine protease n=1 Tax=Anaerosacchariphilus polymeriproducens TaxID=1812858 RepID=A0A371AYL1_9FIRM|nr:S1C family serine protease [Anaerosacchariphilus polymeriproducens]RDU24582.1 serine protease [Anaerosacchariphilus polymeriproducens]
MSDKIEKNQDDTEGFDFIREKIKEKPINRKKVLIGFGLNLIFAIVFGLVACTTFLLAKPYINKLINKTENPTISIPQDKMDDEITEETPDQTEQEKSVPEQVIITNTQQLQTVDYENLQSEIYDIGAEANRSVVTVTGLRKETDLFDAAYQNEFKTTGVIIAVNQHEILIVTDKSIVENIDSIIVTFSNDKCVNAEIKKYDTTLGITVLRVPMEKISEEVKEGIKAATLGNSYVVRQGTTVMAVGNFCGTTHAIAQGNVTASSGKVSVVDANLTVLSTNIPGDSKSSGVLINMKGEVIGLILKNYSALNSGNTTAAVSISDLKAYIECLSNGQDVPRLGISALTVSEEAEHQYQVTKGVYVSDVALDSPSMIAGVQRGDVIIKFNGEKILNMNHYKEALFKCPLEGQAKITVMRYGPEGSTQIECNAIVKALK